MHSYVRKPSQVTELCRRVEMLLKMIRPQTDSTATGTSSTGDGVGSPTSALCPLPCKDASPSKHKAFTSMKAKQNSLPARVRTTSLLGEPQKYQLNLDKDAGNTLCAAKPKSGSGHQSRRPPPVPPRKSIPEIVQEIKQVKLEIEQLAAEVSQSTIIKLATLQQNYICMCTNCMF